MPENEIPVWIVAAYFGCAAASLAAWVLVLGRKAPGEPLLRREPRRPVPWSAVAGLFPALFMLLPLLLYVGQPAAEKEPPANAEVGVEAGAEAEVEAEHESEMVMSAEDMLTQGAFVLGLTVCFLFVTYLFWQPRLTDLGLPTSFPQLVSDIAVGATACVMALVPVYGLHILVSLLLQSEKQHPAIEQLLEHPDFDTFAAALVVAVIAAPIAEEVIFRLLLQGWLEKWETKLLAPSPAVLTPPGSEQDVELVPDGPEVELQPAEQTIQEAEASRNADTAPGPHIAAFADSEASIPARWPSGLPRGWMPILVSSFLFAAGHVGQGPAPIALFVLATGLGYVYQQSHRIVPCIVLHMLFNGLSMAALAALVLGGES